MICFPSHISERRRQLAETVLQYARQSMSRPASGQRVHENDVVDSCRDVMIHKKLLRSRLLFHPLTELNPSLDPAPVIAASIEACLGCETLQMGHVWDVAALLFKLGAREADTETDEAASLGRNQLGPAACTALLTQVQPCCPITP